MKKRDGPDELMRARLLSTNDVKSPFILLRTTVTSSLEFIIQRPKTTGIPAPVTAVQAA
jgi:hypothetical protein